MRTGLAAHRASLRRQQMARSLNARRVACDCCSVYFLTEDETKTTCAWCAKQAKKEIAQ